MELAWNVIILLCDNNYHARFISFNFYYYTFFSAFQYSHYRFQVSGADNLVQTPILNDRFVSFLFYFTYCRTQRNGKPCSLKK